MYDLFMSIKEQNEKKKPKFPCKEIFDGED
jgi:hypothetical protein